VLNVEMILQFVKTFVTGQIYLTVNPRMEQQVEEPMKLNLL